MVPFPRYVLRTRSYAIASPLDTLEQWFAGVDFTWNIHCTLLQRAGDVNPVWAISFVQIEFASNTAIKTIGKKALMRQPELSELFGAVVLTFITSTDAAPKSGLGSVWSQLHRAPKQTNGPFLLNEDVNCSWWNDRTKRSSEVSVKRRLKQNDLKQPLRRLLCIKQHVLQPHRRKD